MTEYCNIETIKYNKVTIVDIAAKLGTTAATVSNALSGKNNISREMREKIISAAEEMGYKTNVTARSLSHGDIRIAVVLSGTPSVISSMFTEGLKKAISSYSGARITCDIITYSNTDEKAGEALELVAGGGYDGLIISYPNIHEYKHKDIIEKINSLNIPVISLVDELSVFDTSANVKVDAKKGGRMAADLIGSSVSSGKVAVFTAVNPLQDIHRIYVDSFSSWIKQYGLTVSDIFYSSDILEYAYSRALDCFSQNDCPKAAFVTPYSAFNVCRAVRNLGLSGKIRIIGTDTIDENIECLKDGSLTALIYQRQDEQIRTAFLKLVNLVLSNSSPEYRNFLITPNIITKGRLDSI